MRTGDRTKDQLHRRPSRIAGRCEWRPARHKTQWAKGLSKHPSARQALGWGRDQRRHGALHSFLRRPFGTRGQNA
jgi:hypothetical protein